MWLYFIDKNSIRNETEWTDLDLSDVESIGEVGEGKEQLQLNLVIN